MNRVLVRRFASALMAAGLIAAASPAVAAPPPTRPDLPLSPLTTVPAGEACEFTLGVSGTDAKARIKTFKNGSQIISGKGYLLTYTNLDTGESLTFETNGTSERTSAPVKSSPDEKGVVTVTATGSNGLVLFESSDESQVPGVNAGSAIQYTGRIVYTIDLDTGVFTLLSASGRQRDLCAELS